ncbi:MAG: NifU family protein [Myxococcales bacterium]|nr:NifU family protein [Myxococcales bacterium]
MLMTLAQRITVRVLDSVIDRGQRSELGGVRLAAVALHRARSIVGLDQVRRDAELPEWSRVQPERPMWDSDRKKLRKWQLDTGIAKDEAAAPKAEVAAAPADALKVYYKRGCPYARAAIELLREREIPFLDQDVKGDVQTLEWLGIVTGKKTTPQIFIHGKPIGGYDELRTLDASGELDRLLGRVTPTSAAANAVSAEEDDVEITVEDLRARIDEGVAVLTLDVRSHAEADETGMIEHAALIPLPELEPRAVELERDAVWIAYCRSGSRSRQAVEILRAEGFRSVVSLRGGIDAWLAAGGPTVRLGAVAPRTKTARVKLTVLHPERSPFEAAGDYAGAVADALEGDALIARVREVLAECRPMIQQDGGDLELLDIVDDVVHVALSGNCIGCPSSQATLKQGIERRLKQAIPQIKSIASPQLL